MFVHFVVQLVELFWKTMISDLKRTYIERTKWTWSSVSGWVTHVEMSEQILLLMTYTPLDFSSWTLLLSPGYVRAVRESPMASPPVDAMVKRGRDVAMDRRESLKGVKALLKGPWRWNHRWPMSRFTQGYRNWEAAMTLFSKEEISELWYVQRMKVFNAKDKKWHVGNLNAYFMLSERRQLY